MRRTRWFLPLIALVLVGADRPLSLTVRAPAGMRIAAATATSTEPKGSTSGSVGDQAVVFANLAANVVYNVRLELADGAIIQGVDLGWYNDEPARPYPGELNDDDRAAIKAIVDDPSFYNKSDILALRGDHSRATALVQLVRDKDFYNGKGEVVWRVELWYFEEEFGGWEKVGQQNRVLRRERFKTHDAFEAAVAKLKWAPELGGILMSHDDEQKIVTLKAHP